MQSEQPSIWSIVFTIGAVLVLLFVVMPLYVRRQKSRFTKLGDLLFGARAFELLPVRAYYFKVVYSVYLKAIRNGREVLISDRLVSKYAPPYAEIFLPTPVTFSLYVSKEDKLHFLRKAVGQKIDINIGDPKLDEKLYFKTDAEHQFRAYSQKREFREFLTFLTETFGYFELRFIKDSKQRTGFKEAFRTIEIDRPGIILLTDSPLPEKPEEISKFRILLEKIEKLN